MKLTNAVREDIARKAIEDLYGAKRDELYKALQIAVTDVLRKRLADFDHVHEDAYRPYIYYSNDVFLGSSIRCYELGFKSLYTIEAIGSFPTFADSSHHAFYAEEFEAVSSYINEYEEYHNTVLESYNSIIAGLRSISTYKQLEEMLPELVKYVPSNNSYGPPLVAVEQLGEIHAIFKKDAV